MYKLKKNIFKFVGGIKMKQKAFNKKYNQLKEKLITMKKNRKKTAEQFTDLIYGQYIRKRIGTYEKE